MQQITKELLSIRDQARRMLIGRRLAQAVAIFIPIAIALIALDFAIRLPSWLRVIMLLLCIALVSVWLIVRLMIAVSFKPTLPDMALRAEKLHPELTSKLAAAVEFDSHLEQYKLGGMTSVMVDHTINEGEEISHGINLQKSMINKKPTQKALLLAACAAGAMTCGIFIVGLPTSKLIATRWLMPWQADAQWATRQLLEHQESIHVASLEDYVMFPATVTQGWKPGMRIKVEFASPTANGGIRWSSQSFDPISSSVEDQTADYEAKLRLSEVLPRDVISKIAGGNISEMRMAYRLRVGDAVTQAYPLTVVSRPEITTVTVNVTPPVYAQSFVEPTQELLHEQTGRIRGMSTHAGASMSVEIMFNKPMPASSLDLAILAPALYEMGAIQTAIPCEDNIQALEISTRSLGLNTAWSPAEQEELCKGVHITFEQPDRTIDAQLNLQDNYKFKALHTADIIWRFAALDDTIPIVALLVPEADIMSTAHAILPVKASASDNLAVDTLEIVGDVQRTVVDPATEEVTVSNILLDMPETCLIRGNQSQLSLSSALNLSQFELQQGDIIQLRAKGQDYFEVNGERHPAAFSQARYVQIVSDYEYRDFSASRAIQLSEDIARLRQTQQTLRMSSPTAAQQRDISEQIEALQNRAQDIATQLRNNVPEGAEGLLEGLDAASEALSEAQTMSNTASDQLDNTQLEAANESILGVEEALERAANRVGIDSQYNQLRDLLRELRERQGELRERTQANAADRASNGNSEENQAESNAIAAEQEQLAEDLQRATNMAEALSQSEGQQSPHAEAMRQAMGNAARQSQAQQAPENAQNASGQMSEQENSNADANMEQVENALTDMESELEDADEKEQDIMVQRLKKLLEDMRNYEGIQGMLLQKTQEAQPIDLPELANQLGLLQNAVSIAAGEARLISQSILADPENPDAPGAEQLLEASDLIVSASREQARGIAALEVPDRAIAVNEQVDAVRNLENAIILIEKVLQEQIKKQDSEKIKKLKELLTAIADAQLALHMEIEPLASEQAQSRRTWQRTNTQRATEERAHLQGYSITGGQAELRKELLTAMELLANEQALAHHRILERVDIYMMTAEQNLNRRLVNQETLFAQERAERLLRMLEKSLEKIDGREEDAPPPENSESENSPQPEGKLIPPTGVLVLIQELEKDLLMRARNLPESLTAQQRESMVRLLAVEQAEVSAIAEEIINQVQQ